MPSRSSSIIVKGEKGQITLPNVPIDSQNFFTTLPSEILFNIGASPQLLKARLLMEDGSSVEAQVFSVVLSAEGREDPTLAITFDDAQPVLGAKFLEDLGLRLNAESDELETSRHRGFAFSEES